MDGVVALGPDTGKAAACTHCIHTLVVQVSNGHHLSHEGREGPKDCESDLGPEQICKAGTCDQLPAPPLCLSFITLEREVPSPASLGALPLQCQS